MKGERIATHKNDNGPYNPVEVQKIQYECNSLGLVVKDIETVWRPDILPRYTLKPNFSRKGLHIVDIAFPHSTGLVEAFDLLTYEWSM